MSTTASKARSIYRSILRELPSRPISTPSPVQQRVRSIISTSSSEERAVRHLQEGEQFIQYAKAQRMYTTLLERYNPGMLMDEEERLRLTMRRVGLNRPDEWKPE